MEKEPEHVINISFNNAGFRGKDLDAVIPDFMTERNTEVGLFWEPSFNGPDSFGVTILITASIWKVSELFLAELFSDLYSWGKKKLSKLLEKKPNNYGSVIVRFRDFEIYCHGYYIPQDKFIEIFQEVPKLLPLLDSSKGKKWLVKFDAESQRWTISPDE